MRQPENHPKTYVVAHDPSFPDAVGEVVSESAASMIRQQHDATLLPISPQLLDEMTLGGFVRRQWGHTGVGFSANRGEHGAPLALQVAAGWPFIHWAVGVQVTDRNRTCQGQLRLVPETAGGLMQGGLTQLRMPSAFEINGVQTTRVITGLSRMTALNDGILGLKLWGVCSNVSVLWVAVSQSLYDT